MKIKVIKKDYTEVMKLKKQHRRKPLRPSLWMRFLLKALSKTELKEVHFKENRVNMEQLDTLQPCLYLMNHSSFIDLKIASKVIYPKPFNIVCTSDGFIGKNWLLRHLGCIPTNKFVTDVSLVKDMIYTINHLHSSILMYPEASYSFDGCSTPLPKSIGKCIKLLQVPVVVMITHGAFIRDPLYNNLQLRKTDVSCDVTYVLSKEDIEEKSADEIEEIIQKYFTFDNFKYQQVNKIEINEPFRADYLHRVLYKCPHCLSEDSMIGRGTTIKCQHCLNEYELDTFGFIKNINGESKFNHIPDWYEWERKCVKEEILSNEYKLDINVNIGIMKNTKAIYDIGEGQLHHSKNGFELKGANGKLHYIQKPNVSYSLYSDYFWYEIGDVICIGNHEILYYCFPKSKKVNVAKARLAQEEIYKIIMKK